MKHCCEKEPNLRPKASEVLEIINRICIKYPLVEKNNVNEHVFLNNDRISKLESQLQETTISKDNEIAALKAALKAKNDEGKVLPKALKQTSTTKITRR